MIEAPTVLSAIDQLIEHALNRAGVKSLNDKEGLKVLETKIDTDIGVSPLGDFIYTGGNLYGDSEVTLTRAAALDFQEVVTPDGKSYGVLTVAYVQKQGENPGLKIVPVTIDVRSGLSESGIYTVKYLDSPKHSQ